jgi:acyl-CoA thioester hydrolase
MNSESLAAPLTVEKAQQLPKLHTMTVPEAWLDEYRHMNVAHYINAWRSAALEFNRYLGFGGMYDHGGTRGLWLLRQVLDYLAEVRLGETLSIHGRMIGRTEKMLHNKYWMVNETTGRIAASSEVLVANADLEARRMTAFDSGMKARMDRHLAEMEALGWAPPLSGAIELR